jgi:chloramphenicol-sensitive protein RarD
MINKNNTNLSGSLYGIFATLLWGSYPLWYKPLEAIGSWELLAWRVVWSQLLLFVIVLIIKRNKIKPFLRQVVWKNIIIMAVILAVWWFIYIYGILSNRILEVSLGYFLSPIMSILVSQIVFKEKTNRIQKISIFLSICSVVIMIFALLDDFAFPWIAITIGFCFCFYGIFKKSVKGDIIITQSFEMLFLLPFAVIFLFWLQTSNIASVNWSSLSQVLLLISTGIISVFPFWWYNIAAKKLTVLSLSFLQFIPPSFSFLLGVFVYQESLGLYKIISFSLIWIAILLLIYNSINVYKISKKSTV